MKWTGLNELRNKFTDFFEGKKHLKLESFSLVPENDKSLLLINSGMAPMKKYFTGEMTPPNKRVTTCQKCIRTPDIERVGLTARHGTYFEMLGNFSFGDYFKKEATAWAWEFCTKVLELPVDKLWVSIYENDDEAFDIWTKNVGVNPERIVRLGKEDNFWEHGSGPCGPCSELYFDRGEEYGCGSPRCGVGCDCDRYVEFWNLVFTQFENDGNNNYTLLEHPNIDTGMGLERIACIMQGVDNLFLVDTIQNIMKHVSRISGVSYGENDKLDISLRVITDHIRSVTFMIGDGVMPSNEGRGYVLRRLLRRAARHGKLLGIQRPFLSEVCDTVIKENKDVYPQLVEKQTFIKKLISVEEENFARTIDQGLSLLHDMIKTSDTTVLSGDLAFKLNDTFGFPIDLTKEILSENGMTVDEARFKELLAEQKIRARTARADSDTEAWHNDKMDMSQIARTEFLGYDCLNSDSTVLQILKNGEFVTSAVKGDKVTIILDKTPFYAQSGGQVGDKGILKSDEMYSEVVDTTKNNAGVFLHTVVIKQGTINLGDSIVACVDEARRNKIMRNHTAAHLLQAALRRVLGTHVEQAGQLVDDERIRFDFTHFSALSEDELKSVEKLVNDVIFKSERVIVEEMPLEEAKKSGAMALFGEKYGKIVRVVKVGDFSTELCGGTHVINTAQLGLFKINSENSVASGVRRIEAFTSVGVLKMINDNMNLILSCQRLLKVNKASDLTDACKQLISELKNNEKKVDQLNANLAELKVIDLINNAKVIKDLKVIVYKTSGSDVESLKCVCDTVKSKIECSVTVIFNINEDKSNIIVSADKSAIDKGINAGKIVKEIAKLAGGNGGGRPEMAMAGIKKSNSIDSAFNKTYDIIEAALI